MLRALVWKEWRQLALVRWGGCVLGALLPVAFMLGSELSQRGLLPSGSAAGRSSRDVMYELLPAALALGIWPLVGLMSAAQAFAGDRAAGTERFLLERPIPAGLVWRVRLLTAFGNAAIVVVATGGLAVAVAASRQPPAGIGWSRFAILAAAGVASTVLALLGSLIASSLISSPMASVLLGAVLGATPVGIGMPLMVFVYARVGRVPLGAVVPILLLPAYAYGSWLALCRGEPAGSGRVRRAAGVVTTAMVAIAVSFIGFAPFVVRANAMNGSLGVVAAPSGGAAFLSSLNEYGTSGWMVDLATAQRRAFVPPPVDALAWSPNGSEVAIVTWSGPLGSIRFEQRIDIRSASDGRVSRSVPVGENAMVHALAWSDAGIVAVVSRGSLKESGGPYVEIVDPSTGAWRPTGFQWKGWPVDLIGPGKDGRVFIRVMITAKPPDTRLVPLGHRLFPVDAAAAHVGPAMSDAESREIMFAGYRDGLSPTGRFARVASSEREAGARILDIQSGAEPPSSAIPSWACWTQGDHLVWHDNLDHDTRLFVETPGAPPRAIRAWRDTQVGIGLSPDGRAVLVSAIAAGEAPATDSERRRPDAALFAGPAPVGLAPEEWVYFPDEDRILSLGPAFSDRAHDHRYTLWAGPATLARIGPGVVYLEDLDALGKRRFVIGSERDLE